ncbi:MAG: ribulose-phosphate 3-epimerase [Patescibacteria group bacterium]
MIEVIPAILTKKKSEFISRLKTAYGFAKTVQIDIMDGLFVDNETPKNLNNGSWYRDYLTENNHEIPNIELHLMVINPMKIIEAWKELAGVMRIIWHVEIPIRHEELIPLVHEMDLQVALAINPNTPVTEILSYIQSKPVKAKAKNYFIDSVLVMGVMPGYSGQTFIKDSLQTIKILRKKFPKLPVAVDGGVNPATARDIIKAGATSLNAAGAIFLADNPKTAYNKLLK